MERLARFATQHGFAVETHETCILVAIPWSKRDGSNGIDWYGVQTMGQLKIVLGY